MQLHISVFMRVLLCLYQCWPVCMLMTYFIPISPNSPPALIPGHHPQIPIGDRSTLEFIPHHSAKLWPSNSQPLWPQQMNNKTRALQQISGKYGEQCAKSWLSPTFTIACNRFEWGEVLFHSGHSNLAMFLANLAPKQIEGWRMTNTP